MFLDKNVTGSEDFGGVLHHWLFTWPSSWEHREARRRIAVHLSVKEPSGSGEVSLDQRICIGTQSRQLECLDQVAWEELLVPTNLGFAVVAILLLLHQAPVLPEPALSVP